MIENLFTTPLYWTNLKLDNKSLQKSSLSLAKSNKGRLVTNHGGWQSNDLELTNDSPFITLFTKVIEHGNIFAKNINYQGRPLSIDNIWVNINGYKDYNSLHHHPNVFLSGVYYVSAPENCGKLNLFHPATELMQYDWSNRGDQWSKFDKQNSIIWLTEVVPGRLYIFPSWLRHDVEPNLNKKEKRISISFNLH